MPSSAIGRIDGDQLKAVFKRNFSSCAKGSRNAVAPRIIIALVVMETGERADNHVFSFANQKLHFGYFNVVDRIIFNR